MEAYYKNGKGSLYNCNCLDLMKGMESNSIDCIATDPPYFLINKSGSGFMGKQWESLNTKRAVEILCRSRKFVEHAERFFLSIAVEKSIIEESSVQLNASQDGCPTVEGLTSNVPCVEKNLADTKVQSFPNTHSAQGIAITKAEVLGLWREMFPNHMTVIESLNENVLFVIPYSLLDAKHTPIAPESVLKSITRAQCGERTIHLTSTEEAKINALIGGLTGTTLEGSYTSGTNEGAGCAESNATAKRYNVTTLDDTKRAEITHWIISLLYASNATQILKESPSHTLMYHFHVAWLEEACRILKPGAFAFITYTPRQDSLGILIKACKDAGLETNFTSIFWCYASGFPKALNIGKAIDRKQGVESNKEYYEHPQRQNRSHNYTTGFTESKERITSNSSGYLRDIATSPEAKEMDGSYAGFQPKPALEVIIVAMKPLSEKTYVEQALKNGKGVTWLDNCRIPFVSDDDKYEADIKQEDRIFHPDQGWHNNHMTREFNCSNKGRFPANLLVSDDVLDVESNGAIAPVKSGQKGFGGEIYGKYKTGGDDGATFYTNQEESKSFSRYFDVDRWFDERVKELPESIRKTYPFLIVPKPSKAEKNLGCEELEDIKGGSMDANVNGKMQLGGASLKGEHKEIQSTKNNHPTVKSIALMSYLITLGSRPNDLIYDPFVGSGTTIIASELLERRWVASELDTKSCEIAKARLSAVPQYAELPTLAEVKKLRTRLTQKNLFDYT